jgi:hypothetical protein
MRSLYLVLIEYNAYAKGNKIISHRVYVKPKRLKKFLRRSHFSELEFHENETKNIIFAKTSLSCFEKSRLNCYFYLH